MSSLVTDASAAAKAANKTKLNGVGLSDKVRAVMGDIVDNQNVSTGADLVAALTKSKEFPEKVKGLNADEAAELDTHLLALLIEQHYKTQLMVDKLNTKLDGMDASLKLNAPNLDVEVPKGPGGFLPTFMNPFGGAPNAPSAPSGPSVEVKVPDIKVDAPSVNVSGPSVPAAPAAPAAPMFPSFSALNPFSAPKAPEVNVASRGIEVEGPEINAKMPTPFDGLKGPEVKGPGVNTPATPLLDWILGLNAADKPAATLPMMIINVATTGVKATPTGIEHSYTVTAVNATPDQLKKLVDDAVTSGAFTKTLKDAGFPNASATKPCTVVDKTPTENPLKRTVVDVTQEIDKLTVADTNTPAFKSAIGGTVPRLAAAAAMPSVPGLPGASGPSAALPPPPMVILDFSLKSVTPEPADKTVTATYSLTALNATPDQIAEVMNNAVACGAFDRALKTAGFPDAKATGQVTVKDVSPEVNPLKKTVLEISQKVTGVTPEQSNSPAFKACLGDAVVSAPSLSLNAPALDEVPKVEVPMFDLDVLIPKFAMLSPVFGGSTASAPAMPAAKLPMMIVNMETKSITPLPANTGITHVYEVTAINCTPKELTDVINAAILKGAMTQSLANAGFPNAVANKPVTERDVTPKDSADGRIVVEYTQVLDKMSMADTQTPAFKSAVAGELPRMAFVAANPTLPAPPAPPVIISVVAKSVTPGPNGGVEVVYAVTAINTTKEGLVVVLDKAIRAGFFTQALKNSGYPNAEARQRVQVFDATPEPNPKKLTVLDVTQTVIGVSMEDANKPEFKMAFSNSIAMAPSVSPEMPELYPDVPTFDFSRLSGMFGGFVGEPAKPTMSLDRSKFPFIVKVSTFSVGPLPFGNGIIHGFLVTAQHTNPTQLTEVINGAIKAGYFTKVFRDAGYATASATEPLDIADDMTSVYYPKENPLERTVLYCQHRIDNLKADDTKSPAFKSAFGWVVPQCADPELALKLKDAKPIIIIECVMVKVVESSSGRSCVADYKVTAINCSSEQLLTIVNNAVKQGVFTSALKDAGFNSAGATDFVTLTDATPTPNPKGHTVCDVTQIVTGITPTEANTPPFGTAMTTAVATAPSCSADPDLHAPGNFNFTLPSLPDMSSVVPKVTFTLPAVFDDGLSHLDPETRKGNTGKASSLRQPDPASKDHKGGAFGMFGDGDDGLPKGGGSLKTEVLPKPGDDLPGLIPGSDGPDEDKYLGAEESHDDDHAVTGHLFYDVYKAVALG